MTKRLKGRVSKRGETIAQRRERRALEHRTGVVVTAKSMWLGKKRGAVGGQHRFSRGGRQMVPNRYRLANGAGALR